MPEFKVGDKVVIRKPDPTEFGNWVLSNFWKEFPDNKYVTVSEVVDYGWGIFYYVEITGSPSMWSFKDNNVSAYVDTSADAVPRVIAYEDVRVGDLILWQRRTGGRSETVQFRVLYAEPDYMAGDGDWAHLDINYEFKQGMLTLVSRPDTLSVGDEIGISSVGEEGTIARAGTVASDGETVVVFITGSTPAFRWHDVESGEMYDNIYPGIFRVLFVPEEEK